jgi:threonyl-tRNA synthetase
MVKVHLPDGQVVEHAGGIAARDVLRAVSPQVARRAVAVKINGQVVDLNTRLTGPDVELKPLTTQEPEGLEVVRHSAAHVMAEALCTLWPQTKLAYGPPVENGFYYDIELDHNLTPEDFARIEAKMAEIVREDRPFTRYDMPREPALAKLRAEGNPYKIDNAERADGDTLSFYVTGPPGTSRFEDLCRGPHVPSTGCIGAFKVMQVAGAYWHGDATKQMLQRVYGTAFPDKKALAAHLALLEEAKRRDHRRIGQELGLFTISPLVGTGLVLWKPHGATVRHILEEELRKELVAHGYQLVYTPHIGRLDLYRTSGHFPYYRESQYPPLFESDRARELNRLWELARTSGRDQATPEELDLFNCLAQQYDDLRRSGYPHSAPIEERQRRIRTWLEQEDGYLLKPMNCPHHIQIYCSDAHSYRDLPVKLAEFGQVYRYEQSGEVGGMVRVRGFCQDDAHIFCTPEQLPGEILECVDLSKFVLEMIGLNDYRVRVALRDPHSDKYIGSDQNWQMAEDALRSTVRGSGLRYSEEIGEAAFYGPKIDFVARDCLGREWQLGTVQVDYNLPERFALTYIGPDNAEHRPVMVHRTLFGSMERFVGILIEHFAGAFPLWLAPIQVRVCSISAKSKPYAQKVYEFCKAATLRSELDNSDERIGAKVRLATLAKIPYILVVGEMEAAHNTVNVRTREGKQYGDFTLPEFLAACAKEITSRGRQALAAAGQTATAQRG